MNNTFETTLSCYNVDYQMTQTGSRTTVTSKMELFATNFDSFHSLTIVKKISILDVLGVVDPTLITDIFVLQSWILIVLKAIFLLYRNWAISFNGKEVAGCYKIGIY